MMTNLKQVNSVLLVDDDAITNAIHKRLITDLKLAQTIEVAHNGQEALDYLQTCATENLPEIILLDINMPLMNGFEFLAEYEKLALAKASKIYVIVLTTSLSDQDKAAADEFNCINGYLNKPMTKEQLTQVWSAL